MTTKPQTAVAYHATYADEKTAKDPDYYGGNKGGMTDGSGVWKDTWIVGVGAPAGPVRVDVIASQGTGGGYQRATFSVSDVGGACS